MPATTAEYVDTALQRAELQTVLQSPLFVRSATLTHLLSYVCEKTFAGQSGQIKEYTIALEVFGRGESFDQDSNSIVRVEINRLRKRLAEYYSGEGAEHQVRISIPVGQYVPLFTQVPAAPASSEAAAPPYEPPAPKQSGHRWLPLWIAIAALVISGALALLVRARGQHGPVASARSSQSAATAEAPVRPAAGEEIRILSGSSRNYVDHSGKLWSPDAYFSGGTAARSSVQRVWRTQDSVIYRNSRQGNFRYDIPLKPGAYELRLHFAETYYGPEEAPGGGEGSRVMTIYANGRALLSEFDVLADSGGGRTADVKVFTDITPAEDGVLHLSFSSAAGGIAMVSGIEIVPGVGGRMRPVRIVARNLPYYSNDSQWWSADVYFKGGQLGGNREAASGTNDPELYETERWGHFSYAIPVTPGKYTLVLHLIEHRSDAPGESDGETGQSAGGTEPRVFDVFCNGRRIVSNLNIRDRVKEYRPLVLKIPNLEPNAQGKLLLEFVPISHYATVSAIEVLAQ